MQLNVISGHIFGMVPQGSRIQSIVSVTGHQTFRNISEPLEFTLIHLDAYADYLRQVEPRTESRAVQALLTTFGRRTKNLVTTHSNQMEQINLDQEELKVRRIGHDVMMEQDAVHIEYEADVTAHLLDSKGKKVRVTGLLDSGAVVSVMPYKDLGKSGLHQGRFISKEPQIGVRQPRSNLRGRRDTSNIPSLGRMRSLVELPGG